MKIVRSQSKFYHKFLVFIKKRYFFESVFNFSFIHIYRGTFSNIDTYLQTQIALNAEFRKTLKPSTSKKRKNIQSSSSEADFETHTHSSKSKRNSGKQKRSKSTKEPLNMNIMFPKKRKKKAVIGTGTSENPA